MFVPDRTDFTVPVIELSRKDGAIRNLFPIFIFLLIDNPETVTCTDIQPEIDVPDIYVNQLHNQLIRQACGLSRQEQGAVYNTFCLFNPCFKFCCNYLADKDAGLFCHQQGLG